MRPFGVTDRVIGGERYLLQSLFEDSRVKQLEDTEAMEPKQAYTVSDMVTDVQSGIWSELTQPHPVIDLFRRNLQRSYIEVLRPKLVGDAITQTELRPVALGALNTLAGLLNGRSPIPATTIPCCICATAAARSIAFCTPDPEFRQPLALSCPSSLSRSVADRTDAESTPPLLSQRGRRGRGMREYRQQRICGRAR